MMSKTHLAMGIATSLAVVQPKTFNECLVAVIGGAVGGVLADIDILENDYKADALLGQLLAMGITFISLVLDYFFQLGICDYIIDRNKILLITGAILFIALWIFGFFASHRTFTHSFTAMAAFTVAVALIYPPLTLGFVAGYFSHLALDILNKKKIKILYPLEFGICFNMFYANKMANSVIMYIGFAALGVLLLVNVASICLSL